MTDCINNYIYIFFESLKAYLMLRYVFMAKTHRKYNIYIFISIAYILIIFAEYKIRMNVDRLWLKAVLLLLFDIFILNEKMIKKVYLAIITYCFTNVADIGIGALIRTLCTKKLNTIENIFDALFMELVELFFYIILSVVINKYILKDKKKPKYKIGLVNVIIGFVELIICFFVLAGSQYMLWDGQNNRLRKIMIVSLSCLCLLLVILTFIHSLLVNSNNYYKKMLKNREKCDNMRMKYYGQQQKYIDEMDKFRHDINKHINYLLELSKEGNNKEIIYYINQITETLTNNDKNVCDCGNKIVSAVITDTWRQCKEKNIVFTYKGKVDENINMKEIDICTLLGNLLENAIEACELLDGERNIEVEFGTTNIFNTIHIENSIILNKNEKNIDVHTSKKNGKHGIGLKNVKEVINKYKGEADWSVKNNKFIVDIRW